MKTTSNRLAGWVGVMGLLASACSNQSIYEGSHQYRADQCAKLPEPEYGECLSEARKPYAEHKKEYDEANQDE